MALNKIERGHTADRMRNQWRNKALRKRGYVEREARADCGEGVQDGRISGCVYVRARACESAQARSPAEME